jgi:hypothetical protein
VPWELPCPTRNRRPGLKRWAVERRKNHGADGALSNPERSALLDGISKALDTLGSAVVTHDVAGLRDELPRARFCGGSSWSWLVTPRATNRRRPSTR